MPTRLPKPQEMQELVAYLPRLYAPGFEPVIRWQGGTMNEYGVYQMPWPEYHPLVEEFFRIVGNDCWLDYDYRPEEAARMLKDEMLVKAASLAQIKTMLTFCLRGERFSDGHWEEMIKEGYIRRILERLADCVAD